ncbi:MAG: hypothetical protein KGI97_02255, partial [Alphaproteobacteria bacterium]|nr:hypothetical protein [Alphaproteobacteria bacterium]
THYPKQRHHTLCVIGGYWRALGEAVCSQALPAVLRNGSIRHTLISATHRKESFYKAKGGRISERAKSMPMAAAMLRRVGAHFDAQKIVFLETTVRDAMAQTMCDRDCGKPIPPGLERLFSPSAASQARPA